MFRQLRFLTATLAAPEYNCSEHSADDWARLFGEPQRALGIWSILLGVASLMLYIPSIRVFFREKRLNCVKIMRFLALVDMLGIFCCGILFGIQMLRGSVFCSDRAFIVVTCLSGYAAWDVSSLTCVFLVLNRIMELTGKEHLFQ
ncbi:hypothetical protein PMAYCL1PPCAC_15200, partial [Pristionchus mayeri]